MELSLLGYEHLFDKITLQAGKSDQWFYWEIIGDAQPQVVDLRELDSQGLREYFVEMVCPIFHGGYLEGGEVVKPNTPRNRLFRTLTSRQAHQLMEQWIFNCFTGRCHSIGIAFDQETPVGFLGLRTIGDRDKIELVGVDPRYRGRGYGRTLVRWARHQSKSKIVEVSTESDNLAAMQIYQQEGFQVVESTPLWYTRVEG